MPLIDRVRSTSTRWLDSLTDRLLPPVGSDDRTHRRGATVAALAFAVASLFLMGVQAVENPVMLGADERAHLGYTVSLLDGTLPTVDTDLPLDDDYPALEEALGGATVESLGPRGDVWVANHPPMNYVIAAPFVWTSSQLGIDRGAPWAMRGVNALGFAVALLLVAGVAWELAPGRPVVAAGAVGLAAAAPQLVSIGSYGYNDGLSMAMATAALVALRTLRLPPSTGRMVGLGVLGGVAGLTRTALVVVVPMFVACWIVAAIRSGGLTVAKVARIAGVAGVPLAIFGWFLAWSHHQYGSLTAAGYLQDKFDRVEQGSTWSVLTDPEFIPTVWGMVWASFRNQVTLGSGGIPIGSKDLELGSSTLVLGLLAALAIAGALRRVAWTRTTRTAGPVALAWPLAGAWVALFTVAVASFVSGGGSAHPRYLFPALPVVAVVLALGMSNLTRAGGVVALAIAGLLAVDIHLLGVLDVVVSQRTLPASLLPPPLADTAAVAFLTVSVAAWHVGAAGLRAAADRGPTPGQDA